MIKGSLPSGLAVAAPHFSRLGCVGSFHGKGGDASSVGNGPGLNTMLSYLRAQRELMTSRT